MVEADAPNGADQQQARNILISGASGMIGTALTRHFEGSEYRVYPLLRKSRSGPFWIDQERDTVHLDLDIPLHAVINLAGANISDRRWSQRRKQEILDSRARTTQSLCQALAHLPHKPEVLLSASAMGYYGSGEGTWIDEQGASGSDFLAEVAKQWERATAPAQEAGIRTVHMRFGLVLSPAGGVLKNFILPFRLACVGAVGDGSQHMSWISIDDTLTIIERLLADSSLQGPFNLVSGDAPTNAEFSAALGRALRRPRLPPLPKFVVRLMFGEMADAALLASSKIRSSRLTEAGITLKHTNLEHALQNLLR